MQLKGKEDFVEARSHNIVVKRENQNQKGELLAYPEDYVNQKQLAPNIQLINQAHYTSYITLKKKKHSIKYTNKQINIANTIDNKPTNFMDAENYSMQGDYETCINFVLSLQSLHE